MPVFPGLFKVLEKSCFVPLSNHVLVSICFVFLKLRSPQAEEDQLKFIMCARKPKIYQRNKSSTNLGGEHVCWSLWAPKNNPPVAAVSVAMQCFSDDTWPGRGSSSCSEDLSNSLGYLRLDFGFWVLLGNGSWCLWLTAGCPSAHSPLLSTVTGFNGVHGHPKMTFSLQWSGPVTRFHPWAYEQKLYVPLPDLFRKTIRYTLLMVHFLLSQKWQVKVEKKDHRSRICPSFSCHKGVKLRVSSSLS